jgi:hypothetical protein
MLVVILGLIGAALVAGAGIGGWAWWKHYQESRNQVATAAVAPPVTPPAVEEKKSPLGDSPAAAPAETAPPAPTPDDTAKAAKRTPKPKVEKAVLPPIPAPAPVPAPPAPLATPPPTPAAPAPKPIVITAPVTVNDAMPFVMNLDQDVPADATEGETVKFTVTQPLQIGDKIVIAKGATVTGAVMGEKGGKFLGIGGHKLTFRLTQVEAADGKTLTVRAIPSKRADGPAIRPFDTGKGTKSKGFAALQGTTYIGYIDGDQVVAVHK